MSVELPFTQWTLVSCTVLCHHCSGTSRQGTNDYKIDQGKAKASSAILLQISNLPACQ